MTGDWTARLRKLNPNVRKAKGDGKARFAPHKALLLLCVIDLADAGELCGPVLIKSPELRLRFDSHWMFDEGLWTVTDSLRVRVAREIFTEWGPEAAWLKARDDKPLAFLDGVSLRPAKEHLAWHRAKRFAG